MVHCWTPHSGRNFLLSATGALGYAKHERDVLGGWSAQGCERKTRLAKQRITVMQSAVVRALQDKSNPDPLCEEESHQSLEAFMREVRMPLPEIERTTKLVASRVLACTVQEVPEPPAVLQSTDQEELVVEQEPSDQEVESPLKKRKENLHTVYSSSRSELLGRDPRSVRAELRDKLEPGYHFSETGRNSTLILHKLGECFAIPGLDYVKFHLLGLAMPEKTRYHQICKLCARGGAVNEVAEEIQSDTQT